MYSFSEKPLISRNKEFARQYVTELLRKIANLISRTNLTFIKLLINLIYSYKNFTELNFDKYVAKFIITRSEKSHTP